MINCSGRNRGEVLQSVGTGIAQTYMNLLAKLIWKSNIGLDTKIRLYKTYIMPVLMYGCETRYLCAYTFDIWALHKIPCHISIVEVRTVSVSPSFQHRNGSAA